MATRLRVRLRSFVPLHRPLLDDRLLRLSFSPPTQPERVGEESRVEL